MGTDNMRSLSLIFKFVYIVGRKENKLVVSIRDLKNSENSKQNT